MLAVEEERALEEVVEMLVVLEGGWGQNRFGRGRVSLAEGRNGARAGARWGRGGLGNRRTTTRSGRRIVVRTCLLRDHV